MTMTLEGIVFRKKVGGKSKTAYDAVFLKTATGDFVLRQPGQNPFKSTLPEDLIGKRIKAEGELVKTIFFVTGWELVE
jgi:hypothetical protein